VEQSTDRYNAGLGRSYPCLGCVRGVTPEALQKEGHSSPSAASTAIEVVAWKLIGFGTGGCACGIFPASARRISSLERRPWAARLENEPWRAGTWAMRCSHTASLLQSQERGGLTAANGRSLVHVIIAAPRLAHAALDASTRAPGPGERRLRLVGPRPSCLLGTRCTLLRPSR
jgi:hypothetical protein